MILLPAHIRPGNWLLYRPDNQYLIVQKTNSGRITLKDYADKLHTYSIDQLSGICLNSDNLKVISFVDQNDNSMFHNKIPRLYIMRTGASEWSLVFDSINKKVSYVHELQNACHEMTNELLEVNLFGI